MANKALTSTLRRSSNNDKDVSRDARAEFPFSSRIFSAVASLRFVAEKMTKDDEQAALLSDFGSVTNATLEDRGITDEKLKREGEREKVISSKYQPCVRESGDRPNEFTGLVSGERKMEDSPHFGF